MRSFPEEALPRCAAAALSDIPVRSAQRIGLGVPLWANNVDVDAASLYAGEFLHVGDHGAKRVPIEGLPCRALAWSTN
jgi:hypothetical protein